MMLLDLISCSLRDVLQDSLDPAVYLNLLQWLVFLIFPQAVVLAESELPGKKREKLQQQKPAIQNAVTITITINTTLNMKS